METVRSQRISPATDGLHTLPLYRFASELEVQLEDFELFALIAFKVSDLCKLHMRHAQASEVMNAGYRLPFCSSSHLLQKRGAEKMVLIHGNYSLHCLKLESFTAQGAKSGVLLFPLFRCLDVVRQFTCCFALFMCGLWRNLLAECDLPYKPFANQNLSEENLRAALSKIEVNNHAMEDVVNKVQNKHYQFACTLRFEAICGSSCDSEINHLNHYFTDNQKILVWRLLEFLDILKTSNLTDAQDQLMVISLFL
ncbi:hypothetical protein Ancab_020457 [Ancistrocladus abbreviatus]